MPRPGPQTGVDEPAFVLGDCPKAALLHVGRRLDGEPCSPDQSADQREDVQSPADIGRDGGQSGGQSQAHPQRLQGPGIEEPDEGRLDRVKACVLAGLADAAEQVGAQASRPDHDEGQQQDGAAVHLGAKADRHRGDGDVRQAPGEIVEALGLQQVGGHKSQPLDQEGQRDRQGEDRDTVKRRPALTAGRGHTDAYQDDDGEGGQPVAIALLHCGLCICVPYLRPVPTRTLLAGAPGSRRRLQGSARRHGGGSLRAGPCSSSQPW